MPRSRKDVPDVPSSGKIQVVLRRADEVGDRQVAREIGVSQTTIGNWRQGKKQNNATIPKVDRWWIREGHKLYAVRVDDEDAFLAIKAIVEDVPPRRRKSVARRLVDVMHEEHGRGSASGVAWPAAKVKRRISRELT